MSASSWDAMMEWMAETGSPTTSPAGHEESASEEQPEVSRADAEQTLMRLMDDDAATQQPHQPDDLSRYAYPSIYYGFPECINYVSSETEWTDVEQAWD
jgi:hypothetical protein